MNFLTLFEEKFGKDYIRAGNSEITYNCPFCLQKRGKSDDDHKLWCNTDSGKWHCFKCDAKGRLSKLLPESTDGIYGEIAGIFQDRYSTVSEDDDSLFYLPNIHVTPGILAYEYCQSRGITDSDIEFYDIRLGTDRLFGRIVIPNVVYTDSRCWTDMYSARTYIGQEPKYLNPEYCHKTNSVFNLHNQTVRGDLIVVEGVITAIAAGRNAVAVYGCHPSEIQLQQILLKRPKSIICCLDGDSAGKEPNRKMAEVFAKNSDVKVYLVEMPEKEDAASMGREKYLDYISKNKVLYSQSVYTEIELLLKGK